MKPTTLPSFNTLWSQRLVLSAVMTMATGIAWSQTPGNADSPGQGAAYNLVGVITASEGDRRAATAVIKETSSGHTAVLRLGECMPKHPQLCLVSVSRDVAQFGGGGYRLAVTRDPFASDGLASDGLASDGLASGSTSPSSFGSGRVRDGDAYSTHAAIDNRYSSHEMIQGYSDPEVSPDSGQSNQNPYTAGELQGGSAAGTQASSSGPLVLLPPEVYESIAAKIERGELLSPEEEEALNAMIMD